VGTLHALSAPYALAAPGGGPETTGRLPPGLGGGLAARLGRRFLLYVGTPLDARDGRCSARGSPPQSPAADGVNPSAYVHGGR
jgi:hypothetical protein